MEKERPIRSSSKPERIVEFFDCITRNGTRRAVEYTAIEAANRWLAERAGTVDIILCEIGKSRYSNNSSIIIWYQER